VVMPEFERAVKQSMKQINAKAAAFSRDGAVRLLVERAMKKFLLCQSDLSELEQQDLKLRIRSEFDKVFTGRQGSMDFYFPSGS
jgi:hypothetical protein